MPYYTVTLPPPAMQVYPFNKTFSLSLMLAVGGNFPGNPDGGTFPQRMIVDYVRVFK